MPPILLSIYYATKVTITKRTVLLIMCLIAIAYKVHPDLPFIVTANRDEFYERPTEKAHYWTTQTTASTNENNENENENGHDVILAGKDLESGGTWLGITKSGKRFAAITNYRKQNDPLNPKPEHKKSRGHLVSNFLLSKNDGSSNEGCIPSAKKYLEQLCHNNNAQYQYDGFSLIIGDCTGLYCYSNRDPKNEIIQLQPGNIYALCNRLLEDPWPKLCKIKKDLNEILINDNGFSSVSSTTTANSTTKDNAVAEEKEEEKEKLEEKLFQILMDESRPSIDELPIKSTGCSQDIEELLSSIFIHSDFYGTRSSTVITISNQDNTCVFEERSFGKNGMNLGNVRESFQLTSIPGQQ